MKLKNLVDIIMSSRISCTQEKYEKVLVLTSNDFAKSGYTRECEMAKKLIVKTI